MSPPSPALSTGQSACPLPPPRWPQRSCAVFAKGLCCVTLFSQRRGTTPTTWQHGQNAYVRPSCKTCPRGFSKGFRRLQIRVLMAFPLLPSPSRRTRDGCHECPSSKRRPRAVAQGGRRISCRSESGRGFSGGYTGRSRTSFVCEITETPVFAAAPRHWSSGKMTSTRGRGG